MPVIAIDMGGTKIKFGIVDNAGKIISVSKLEASPGETTEKNLEKVNESVNNLLLENDISRGKITSIGVAVPSIVDDNNHVVTRYVKYKDANEFDFNIWAKQNWGLPIVVENDARAALIGEWQYGAGKGYSDIGLLTLGTGVGTAILSGGKLYKGRHFLGGSLGGHTSINFDGDPCNCGFFGCLETEASTWALNGLASRHALFNNSTLSKIEKVEFIHLFNEMDHGDELARILFDQCLKAWGTAIVNMVHSHDPELIIISGGIMKRQAEILPFFQKMIDQYAWLPAGTIKIKSAQEVEYAGLLGMEYLATSLIK